ncbi:MAG: hypothetical protein WCU00_11745 [Candidatus Latescibacterota bacterium]
MKRFFLLFVIFMPVLILANTVTVAAQITSLDNPDVASLKATHERMLKAWSDHDIETIVEICNGAVGLVTPPHFPVQSGSRVRFVKGWRSFTR